MPSAAAAPPLVSIIVAVHNGAGTLDECFESVLSQTYAGPLEVCVYDDASGDGTPGLLRTWAARFAARGIGCVLLPAGDGAAAAGAAAIGPGPARNAAVAASHGAYLCILDADDMMAPGRVGAQLPAAAARPRAIVGCRFDRTPPGSTARYTAWANRLTPAELYTQAYRELTVINPTWFMARAVFERAGGYPAGRGEDLRLFYSHLDAGGELHIVDEVLLTYRYSAGSFSSSVPRRLLFAIRSEALERRVLASWPRFSIWGAGRDGKYFFGCLSPAARARVTAFIDVDVRKVGGSHSRHDAAPVPIVHFTDAVRPFIVCVAMDRGGGLEENVRSLGLTEGVDYYHFC